MSEKTRVRTLRRELNERFPSLRERPIWARPLDFLRDGPGIVDLFGGLQVSFSIKDGQWQALEVRLHAPAGPRARVHTSGVGDERAAVWAAAIIYQVMTAADNREAIERHRGSSSWTRFERIIAEFDAVFTQILDDEQFG